MSHPARQRRPENRWTAEEDEILIAAIEQCGPIIIWSQVSACLPHRNNKSCRKRWIHSLDPSLRKGRWTEEEDASLVAGVGTYGTHWFQVAKLLPGRTDDQCAKRWRENLDPAISREPWTPDEDAILMDTFEKLGKRWKDIASCFDGRPPVHCRNRVQSLVRARRRAAKVRTTGKGKTKTTQRPTYDTVMTAGSPVALRFDDSWARRSPSSYNNATDSSEVESVSSTASGDLSMYPQTSFSLSQETYVENPSYEEISSPSSAARCRAGTYPPAQSQSQQIFYPNILPSASPPSMASSDWNTVQLCQSIHPQLDISWEKSNNFASFGPNFSEMHGTQGSPAEHPLSVDNLSLTVDNNNQQYSFNTDSSHHLYHFFPQSQLHHQHQWCHQQVQNGHEKPTLGDGHSWSHQTPAQSNLAPPQCIVNQANMMAPFSSATLF